uniref:Uncharacterized protein n=1 Tax=Aegilops tauschii subsp. strangulata TaxID=200361 RepID=A0A453Q6S8_AEGTS
MAVWVALHERLVLPRILVHSRATRRAAIGGPGLGSFPPLSHPEPLAATSGLTPSVPSPVLFSRHSKPRHGGAAR